VPGTRFGKRPGPLSQEGKLLTLDAWEALEELQQTARQFHTVASFMAAGNVPRGCEQAKEWAAIYRALDNILRDFTPLLPLFRLDRGVLFSMYAGLRHLKARWIKERMRSFFNPAVEPDGFDATTRAALLEEEAVFTRLIDQFKRLVVAAP
jgi:hypothetical protein